MKLRTVAAVLAVLLGVMGTIVLVSYVRGADARALAGTETVEVLVVAEAIPAGTRGDELAELVKTTVMPASVVLSGSIDDLAEIEDTVTTVDMVPGEQLLSSRFVKPEDLVASGVVAVPAGMQEVTVLLEPQRVIGGDIAPGATVGVFVSDLESKTTHLVLHKALVTDVQGQPTEPEVEPGEDGAVAAPLPEGSLMVTLALDAPSAERLVFGMEHGGVWLSAEPLDATEDGTAVLNWGSVYE